jgi:hypothetical protein
MCRSTGFPTSQGCWIVLCSTLMFVCYLPWWHRCTAVRAWCSHIPIVKYSMSQHTPLHHAHNYLVYSTLINVSDLANTFVIQVVNHMEKSPFEKLNSHSANQEIPTFYETRRFVAIFTRAHPWSLSWVKCIQLSFHFNINSFTCGLFLSGFVIKCLIRFSCLICAIYAANIILDLIIILAKSINFHFSVFPLPSCSQTSSTYVLCLMWQTADLLFAIEH